MNPEPNPVFELFWSPPRESVGATYEQSQEFRYRPLEVTYLFELADDEVAQCGETVMALAGWLVHGDKESAVTPEDYVELSRAQRWIISQLHAAFALALAEDDRRDDVRNASAERRVRMRCNLRTREGQR